MGRLRTFFRSAVSGRYVESDYADDNPSTTVSGVFRSACDAQQLIEDASRWLTSRLEQESRLSAAKRLSVCEDFQGYMHARLGIEQED